MSAITRMGPLQRGPMSVSEALDAALQGGYNTTSPTFRQIVNITLIRSDEFERMGRGLSRVK